MCLASLCCPGDVSARIRPALVAGGRLPYWSGDQSVPDSLPARQLARSPHSLRLLSRHLVRWLLIEATAAHLPEHTFALHLLLQDAKRLLDVVVTNEYLHALLPRSATPLERLRSTEMAAKIR